MINSSLKNVKSSITELIGKLKIKAEYPKTLGACFIASTLILASSGLVKIEDIKVGDLVYSFNTLNQEVSKQAVEETFVRESNELVHITANGETISSTPDHPFYVPQKGFVKAVNLRAGDILWTVNGEYVVVEKVQHEILESPVKVFNFRVADNHTYFVGNNSVGVHNSSCTSTSSNNKLPDENSQLKHIFRKAEGHFEQASPENCHLLESVANDTSCKLGTDLRGETWYAKETIEGKQIWVECRNGIK